MGLIFDYVSDDKRGTKESEGIREQDCRAGVENLHKRLWQSLRQRLGAPGADKDLDGLKLLKGYADILSIITKTERLIWGMEEKAPGQEVYCEDEIAEAMARITFSQGAEQITDGK